MTTFDISVFGRQMGGWPGLSLLRRAWRRRGSDLRHEDILRELLFQQVDQERLAREGDTHLMMWNR